MLKSCLGPREVDLPSISQKDIHKTTEITVWKMRRNKIILDKFSVYCIIYIYICIIYYINNLSYLEIHHKLFNSWIGIISFKCLRMIIYSRIEKNAFQIVLEIWRETILLWINTLSWSNVGLFCLHVIQILILLPVLAFWEPRLFGWTLS